MAEILSLFTMQRQPIQGPSLCADFLVFNLAHILDRLILPQSQFTIRGCSDVSADSLKVTKDDLFSDLGESYDPRP